MTIYSNRYPEPSPTPPCSSGEHPAKQEDTQTQITTLTQQIQINQQTMCAQTDQVNAISKQISDLTQKLAYTQHQKNLLLEDTKALDRQLAYLDGRYHKAKPKTKSRQTTAEAAVALLEKLDESELQTLLTQYKKGTKS